MLPEPQLCLDSRGFVSLINTNNMGEVEKVMQTYTYVSKGKFELKEKPKPLLMHERDAIVKVTLASHLLK